MRHLIPIDVQSQEAPDSQAAPKFKTLRSKCLGGTVHEASPCAENQPLPGNATGTVAISRATHLLLVLRVARRAGSTRMRQPQQVATTRRWRTSASSPDT